MMRSVVYKIGAMKVRSAFKIVLAVGFILIVGLTLIAAGTPSWEQPPDAILSPPPFIVHPSAQGLTHRFEIPAGQPKDHWIRALQFQSCNPDLVKSAYFYIEKTGQWLGAWTPGGKIIAFPDTVAALLPSTSKVIVDIHYASVAEDVADCSTIGLYFTDKKPLRPLLGMGVQTPVQVPSGTGLELRKEFTVIADSYAIALQPEMRAAGRSVEVTAVDPSGTSQTLYGDKNVNGGQPAPYAFAQPVFIPRGTRIIATASYQNADPQNA